MAASWILFWKSNMNCTNSLALLGCCLLVTMGAIFLNTANADDKKKDDETRIERGTVKWHRDFEAAKLQSAKTKLPLFVQFQEIPG